MSEVTRVLEGSLETAALRATGAAWDLLKASAEEAGTEFLPVPGADVEVHLGSSGQASIKFTWKLRPPAGAEVDGQDADRHIHNGSCGGGRCWDGVVRDR